MEMKKLVGIQIRYVKFKQLCLYIIEDYITSTVSALAMDTL